MSHSDDVSAAIVFHTDYKYILKFDLSIFFFLFARNQIQISSSANEQAKSAGKMPRATGLVLGMYKNLTNDTELAFLCILYFYNKIN